MIIMSYCLKHLKYSYFSRSSTIIYAANNKPTLYRVRIEDEASSNYQSIRKLIPYTKGRHEKSRDMEYLTYSWYMKNDSSYYTRIRIHS
jgi:hypothetical protein